METPDSTRHSAVPPGTFAVDSRSSAIKSEAFLLAFYLLLYVFATIFARALQLAEYAAMILE